MRLGITVDMSGAHPRLDIERVKEAERLGFSQAWTGEAYGTDAVTPATWMLAHTTKLNVGTGIMQIPARTPTMAAMTAMTLQHLSGGRFLCGLGVSGPQVIEGWHGTRFGKPMTRTKEYIAIIKQILERKGPLVFKGEEYEIPYAGPDATGLGKPLRSITHGDPEEPVRVTAKTQTDGAFELTVTNFGAPISSKAMQNLFKPFSRGDRPSHRPRRAAPMSWGFRPTAHRAPLPGHAPRRARSARQ